jgi:hypothetical protein
MVRSLATATVPSPDDCGYVVAPPRERVEEPDDDDVDSPVDEPVDVDPPCAPPPGGSPRSSQQSTNFSSVLLMSWPV